MENAAITLFFDIALAALLIATIVFCARLSRRIRSLQDGRSELGQMIEKFDQATARASASMAEMQAVSRKITDALALKIDKANFLADDLAFLIERASKMLQEAKAPAPKTVSATAFAAAPPAAVPAPPPAEFRPGMPSADRTNATAQADAIQSLEAVLQRLASVTAPAKSVASTSSAGAARTGAERDLIEAMKAGRS